MHYLKKINPNIILFLIIILHLLILIHIAFWPYPEFRTYPYLTSHGLIPYKEIIDQHFPGLFFFPFNLYSLGLATPFGLRAVQFFIVAVTQVLIYLTMKKLTRSSYYSLLANVLFLIAQPLYEGYVLWVDSLISPLILFSYYLLINSEDKKALSSKKYFISGFFLALSVLIKQPVFPVFVFLLAYWLVLKVNIKKLVYFLAGFAIPILYLVAYIQQLGIWKEFWYWNFIFNETVYPKYFFRAPTIKEDLLMLPLMAAFAVCSIYFLLQKKKRKTVGLLLIYGVPILTLLYGTWAFVHLQPFLPFAVIVITLFFLTQARKKALIGISLYSFLLLLVMLTHVWHVGNSSTIHDSDYSALIQKMHTLATKKKSIYLYKMDPQLYQLSDMLPANRFYVPDFPWYNVLLDEKVYKSLKKSRPDVVITPAHYIKTKVIEYLTSVYKKISVVDGAAIWMKK